MSVDTETAHAVGNGLVTARRDPSFYRVWIEQRIHDCVEQNGVIALFDWFNQCEEIIVTRQPGDPPIHNIDITLDAIRKWFDTRYNAHPTEHTSLRMRRRHSLTTR